MIEGEEVDERKVPEDVDHRATRAGLADRLRPRFIDRDVLEKAVVSPGEGGIRLVGNEGLFAHGVGTSADRTCFSRR